MADFPSCNWVVKSDVLSANNQGPNGQCSQVMTHSKWIHGTGVPTFPKDPGSPSENGFMEPKYCAFRR